MRQKKTVLEFNAETLQKMLQATYREIEETGIKATNQYMKQNRDLHDNQDIALISKSNAEYLKIRNDTSEKKITILKLMKDIVYKDASGANKNTDSQAENAVLSSEDKKNLFKMIKGGLDKNNVELTLKDEKNTATG